MTQPMNEKATSTPDLGGVGLWSAGFDGLSPSELADVAAELDDLGFGTAWFGEAYGREAFSQAQLMLNATGRMVIATGIANIWARDAMACNAATRTLASAHPGRFLLGLGVSHQPLVTKMRGHEYDKPLAAMRGYLRAMDSAPYIGWGATCPRPARVLAALAPGMLATARDQADGAAPYLTLPAHTAAARAVLGPDKLLAPEVSCVLTNDVDVWQERAHSHLELYTGLPNYVNNWKRLGFTDDDMVRGGSNRLKEALVCRGLDATLRAIGEHRDAGADHVCVQVLGESTFVAPLADWRLLAEAIR
jgi:probable F420-dependent oxidoreductase